MEAYKSIIIFSTKIWRRFEEYVEAYKSEIKFLVTGVKNQIQSATLKDSRITYKHEFSNTIVY